MDFSVPHVRYNLGFKVEKWTLETFTSLGIRLEGRPWLHSHPVVLHADLSQRPQEIVGDPF